MYKDLGRQPSSQAWHLSLASFVCYWGRGLGSQVLKAVSSPKQKTLLSKLQSPAPSHSAAHSEKSVEASTVCFRISWFWSGFAGNPPDGHKLKDLETCT
mmetsp:Transcript_38448/g.60019  ORF Transcript_38448/g.60019 Transcript_38448/m.60019 type:complete len:99 (+) Transcript_38448:4400-4696(+)